MLKMFDSMYKRMPKGMYVLQTDTYGDTGGAVEREQLREELQRVLHDYDKAKYKENRFMFRVAGFRWMSTKLHGAEIQLTKRDEAREGQRAFNKKKRDQLRREIAATRKRQRKKTK
jgi:hypothetical protein